MTGILILVGVGVVWFFFMFGFSHILNQLGIFAIISGIIIAFFSMVGMVIAYMCFSKANQKYIDYKRLELEDKQ